MSDAARLMALFEGYADAYGTHGSTQANADKGGKLEIKKSARTIRSPVTLDIWESHVRGEQPLGIIPVRADNTCMWGVIDVDQYDLSHAEIVLRLKKNNLPLHVCRSKSGGAHLFVFMAEPIPAVDLMKILRDLAARLGWGTSEVFPKQTEVMVEKGDLGNWLNMPYYGGDKSDRYCFGENGRGLTLSQFLKKAEASRLTIEGLAALLMDKQSPDDIWADGPPCLQHLAASGFPQGSRNNGLFAVATFLKRKFPADWQARTEDVNHRYFQPPLPAEEVSQVINQVKKKEYNYRCSDQPIAMHCNAGLCRTRRFGVGGGSGAMPTLDNLSVIDTDEPVWFLDISGKRVELSTDELQNPGSFQRRCMEVLHICPPVTKRETWQGILQGLLENVTIIEAPDDVGQRGQFFEIIETFCTDRQRAQTREEILLGKAWWDDERGVVHFRLRDIQDAMERAKFRGMSRTQMTAQIRTWGGEHSFLKLKGRGVNLWSLPTTIFSRQSDTHSLPKLKEEII